MQTHSPKLSVILTVYNGERDLDNCLASLLAQTYRSFEIILINDGSTDATREIANHYASENDNIIVIDQPNGGVSRGRNAGLAIARGEYVTFMDADDTLLPEMYQTLMTMAEQDNLDVAQGNAVRYDPLTQQGKPLIPTDRLHSTAVMSGPEWLKTALSTRRWLHVVWLGAYRMSLIKELNLLFEPGLHHQDIPWSTEFMFNAKRVRYTEQVLYRYHVNDNSISHQKRTGSRNVEYQQHYIKIAGMLETLNQRYKDKIKIYPEFHKQVVWEALTVCHAIRREPDVEAQKAIIENIYASGTDKRMMRNARGLKQWWQLLLWLCRIRSWRNKGVSEQQQARA